MSSLRSDNPPTFNVGDVLGAKYNGCFYKARIVDVNKKVLCRVCVKGKPGVRLVNLSNMQGSIIEPGKKAFFETPTEPSTKCLIKSIRDHSIYTVCFEDGIRERVVRHQLSKTINPRDKLDWKELSDGENDDAPELKPEAPKEEEENDDDEESGSDEEEAGSDDDKDEANDVIVVAPADGSSSN